MRLIDADKLEEVLEGTDWYSLNKDGVLHHGAANRDESYYRGSDVWSAIEKAPTVFDKERLIFAIQASQGIHSRILAEMIADVVIACIGGVDGENMV